jgi:hypothetical protein
MRNEISSQIPKDVLQAAVRDEMSRERRRAFFRKISMKLVLFVVSIVILVSAVGYVVAASGFANVPVFTNAVYEPAKPTRVVFPLVGASYNDLLIGIAARTKVQPQSQTASIYASEIELTTLVASAVTQESTLQSVQVVVTPAFLEVSGVMHQDTRQIPMVISVYPSVENGDLVLQVVSATVGSLRIPAFVVNAALKSAAHNITEGIAKALGGGRLENVVLENGKMTAMFSVPQ